MESRPWTSHSVRVRIGGAANRIFVWTEEVEKASAFAEPVER